MAKNNDNFVYEIIDDFGVVDEKNNQVIKFTRISFNGKEPALDVRKWNVENKRMFNGIHFFNDEGFSNLIHKGIECGFGDTETIINLLKERESKNKELTDYDNVIPITKKSKKEKEPIEQEDVEEIEKSLIMYT